MGRSRTDSFVVEIPLRANSKQTKKALARFEAGRQIYNACLGEALKRRDQMLRSKMYRAAQVMPHKTKEEIEAGMKAFVEARGKYGFTEYSLHSYVGRIRNSWLGEHIDANTAQTLATRAYRAVNKTVTGEAERVRFKRYVELDTLEGKTNKQGIRWRDGRLVWNGLELPAIIDRDDPVITHGLSCPIKFVRLIKRTIRGRVRLYAQLVCEGRPYQKEKNYVTERKIGLDIGPSTAAEVGDTEANLHLFCRELDDIHAEITQLPLRTTYKFWNLSFHYGPICPGRPGTGRSRPGGRRWALCRTRESQNRPNQPAEDAHGGPERVDRRSCLDDVTC